MMRVAQGCLTESALISSMTFSFSPLSPAP
jgi:hypothetical protein